jgi:hypothetical protein
MIDRVQEERDVVLFALVCLAAVRSGALEQPELLRIDAAVRGLQLLAERDEVPELEGDDAVARMSALWARYGPAQCAFAPEWVAVLRSQQRELADALALATATVNYWERGPAR